MNAENKRIRIGIVESQAVIRECLVNYLQSIQAFEIVFQAGNGEEAITCTRKHKPHVVLTEVAIPRVRGDTVTAHIRKKYANVKVLALTSIDKPETIAVMLLNGCNGYLLKSAPMAEVVKAIACVIDCEFYYNKHVTRQLRENLLRRKVARTHNMHLTKSEKRVMHFVCRQMTSREIAMQLNISHRTVEKHCENILLKTGEKNAVGIALYAIKNGIFIN
ncbi:MAG TPA: response regulator transcription factor [Flavobacteriales bacterium]|nr:response regulator transcription factor [Flavobacteriales bacterium]